MFMKKTVALLLVALVLFPSMAFGVDSSQEAKRFKVWFDTGGGPGESYGTVLQNGAAAAARDLDLDIVFVYSDWNAEKMLENFRQGLTSKPDGMVVIGVPGDDAYEPLIDQAYAQGALVTCVDTPLPRLYQKYQSRGFGMIGPDNYNQGRMLAERCVAQFDLKKGDRVMVWGLKSLPGRGRRAQAILDVFEKAGLTADYIEISPEINKDATLGCPVLTVYLSSHEDCSLSPATAEAIRSGYLDLVGEGQPYLIGYLAVVNLVQSRLCGFGGLVIDTAGGFVDKDNIEQIAPLAEKGVR